MIPWLKEFFTKMKMYFPNLNTDTLENSFVPRWKVSILKSTESLNGSHLNEDIYYAKGYNDTCLNATCFELGKNIRTTDETHFQVLKTLKNYNHRLKM